MKTSETITKISAALARAQIHIGGAEKSAKNPFHKSQYANLTDVIAACKAALCAESISVLQLVGSSESGAYTMTTTLLHESGEYISATMNMPIPLAKATDPQAMGSAVTYCRRYQLQAFLNIPAVDDDAEFAKKAFADAPVTASSFTAASVTASTAPEEKPVVIEAQVLPAPAEPAESWHVQLEAAMAAHEDEVNTFLRQKEKIWDEQTWRDLPAGAYRNRIVKQVEKFIQAVKEGSAQ